MISLSLLPVIRSSQNDHEYNHDYMSEKVIPTKGKRMKTRNVITRSNQQDNQNALFDMRVNTITEGLHSYVAKTLKQLPYEKRFRNCLYFY